MNMVLLFLCLFLFQRQSVQRKVPQAPAGPVRPAGGALRGPDGVLHSPVHPPRLREGVLGACQVRRALFPLNRSSRHPGAASHGLNPHGGSAASLHQGRRK